MNKHTTPIPPGNNLPPVTAALPVSCGTLIVNPDGLLLLCHVTNTAKWDIPKGMQDSGELTLEAAMRELREEAGIAFAPECFADLGLFDYRPDKRLHLYLLHCGDELASLDHLKCTSFFPHHATGDATPEVDGYRWAARGQLAALCWPRMAQRLQALHW
ncbi:MAG: NUDIX hydrolase [Massilia sp.]|nr:NUDIX hydrolase [Massilia sp.]